MLEETENEMEDVRRSRCWSQKKRCHRLSLLAAKQWEMVDVFEHEEKVQQQELVVDAPFLHASKEDYVGVVRSLPERIKKHTGKIVGVPVPHIKKESIDVPVDLLHVRKEFVSEPVPHIKKEIREEIMDILQQRTCERTVEQIDGLVQCVTKEIREEIKVNPQERTCERTGEQIDGLVLCVTNEIREEIKVNPQERTCERTGCASSARNGRES